MPTASSTQRHQADGQRGRRPFYTDMPDDTTGPVMVFCGTVTPTQSAQFGQYSPIRNVGLEVCVHGRARETAMAIKET